MYQPSQPYNDAISSSKMNSDSVEKLKTSSSEFLDEQLSKNNNELSDTSKFDAGLKPTSFYEQNLTPLRFKIRSLLLRIVQDETPLLAKIQKSTRSDLLDIYFPYTANLGSHTFYVLLLPVPAWFGYLTSFRDLVFVLGFGIYFSGVVKDYLCLPRPKSPPLHRITLSHYTSKEYGCPSSHTANATGVSLIFLIDLIGSYYSGKRDTQTTLIFLGLLGLYYFSLVFGRIYCGMHGFVDITVGWLIGLMVVILRRLTASLWDSFVMSGSMLVPIVAMCFYYAFVYYHPVPLDHCPCFDDSVAFMGVFLGVDLSHWVMSIVRFEGDSNPCLIPFDVEIGIVKSIARIMTGMILVAIWKTVSKPIITKLYRPWHAYLFSNKLSSTGEKKKEEITEEITEEKDCGALQERYSLTIFVRMTVYAGISVFAVFVSKIGFNILGLGVKY